MFRSQKGERLHGALKPRAGRDAPASRLTRMLALAVATPLLILYVWLILQTPGGWAGFRFAHPWALFVPAFGVALLVWDRQRRRTRKNAVLRYARASELAHLPRGWVARLEGLPFVLRVIAVALVGFAVARPQSSRIDDQIELEGIDVVVVLDASGSMEARDLVPNRLEAAKAVIRRFVKRRRSDRLGLVLFAQDAYTYIPLTLDHGTYLRMLDDLRVGLIDGRGTAIGNGLGVALARLRKSEAASKVVILLTDGDNNAGNISPAESARMAETLGVKIYTILAGDHDLNRPDVPGGRKNPVNPKLLEDIAAQTGGQPYLAGDTRALEEGFESILRALETSKVDDRAVLYAELFPWLVAPALLLLLFELGLSLTRWRRLP